MNRTSVNTGKSLKIFGCLIAAGALALNASAAESANTEPFRAVESSSSDIGKEVRDSAEKNVGRITDFALDVENGRLVEVIISSGGFLGFGPKTTAVPPGALRFDSGSGIYHLNVDKEKFKAAPDFAISKWAEHTQSARVAEVYRYYDQAPYFAADGQGSPSGNTSVEPLGYIQRSSKLMQLPVSNQHYEKLGNVEAFMYSVARGRISHVMIMSPGYLDTKRVIAPKALKFNAAHDGFVLEVSKEEFANEPRFKWTGRGLGDFQQQPFSDTKVAANDGVNTRQNVQEGIVTSYVPLVQGASFADVDKTWRIYSAMRADASLSQNAQNVEVGTLNGRVTLRGHVNTEAGKAAIGKIAETAGRPENVSNLIEVRPRSVTQ